MKEYKVNLYRSEGAGGNFLFLDKETCQAYETQEERIAEHWEDYMRSIMPPDPPEKMTRTYKTRLTELGWTIYDGMPKDEGAYLFLVKDTRRNRTKVMPVKCRKGRICYHFYPLDYFSCNSNGYIAWRVLDQRRDTLPVSMLGSVQTYLSRQDTSRTVFPQEDEVRRLIESLREDNDKDADKEKDAHPEV